MGDVAEKAARCFFSWDNDLPSRAAAENRAYRNIADLLVVRSPHTQSAMRLCGVPEDRITGGASDYEKFCALLDCLPLLTGHRQERTVRRILSTVFSLSPEEGESGMLWKRCCERIRELRLSPLSLAAALGVETLFLRFSPFDDLVPESPTAGPSEPTGFPSRSLPGARADEGSIMGGFLPADEILPDSAPLPRCRPVFDLGDPCALPLDGLDSLAALIERLSARLDAFLQQGCPAARLMLTDYRYDRNARKNEVDGILRKLRDGLPVSSAERDQFRTSFFLQFSPLPVLRDLPLLLTVDSDPAPLTALLAQLTRNDPIPETVLLSPHPQRFLGLIDRFAFSTPAGLPGIVPAVSDPQAAAAEFPIGVLLLRGRAIIDPTDFAEAASGLSPALRQRMRENAARRFDRMIQKGYSSP